MNFVYLLMGCVAGLVAGIVGMSFIIALSLSSAHNEGKIVLLEEDALKEYFFVIGIHKESFKTDILYRDKKVSIHQITHEDILKDLDLDEHR